MRKLIYIFCTTVLVALVGCVTINVYFPEAAAQKAADQFIGTVLDSSSTPASKPAPAPSRPVQTPAPAKSGPSAMLLDLLVPAAYAQEEANIRISTPAIEAIHARLKQRFGTQLKPLLDAGAVGFTADGLVALRDAGKVPLAQRNQAQSVVAQENADRSALYQEVANANGHPDWASKIRDAFAKGWIERAHGGWYYQDASGAWRQK